MRSTKTFITTVVIDINTYKSTENSQIKSALESLHLTKKDWSIQSYAIKDCSLENGKLSFTVEVVLLEQ